MENFQTVIEDLRKRAQAEQAKENQKLSKRLNYTANVFEALDEKGVEPSVLNDQLKELKELLVKPELRKSEITRYYSRVLSFVQKEYGYVTDKYYQNQWMALGMTVFGLPFGLMFGFALDNFAFLGIGLPLGMPIGIAIGAQKDKQAKEQGLQLQISCDY